VTIVEDNTVREGPNRTPLNLDLRQCSRGCVTAASYVSRRSAIAEGMLSATAFSLRKEVIQPQVLLRLPCYDFTPIMNYTLDGCLSCELAHRLLVQPTFVM
jgi:hypothetical protein